MDEAQGGGDQHAPPKLDRRRRQLRNFRFLLILPFVATATLVAPLAYLTTGSEVEVILKVSQMSFKVGQVSTGGTFNPVKTRSLSLLNFQTLDLCSGLLEMARAGEPTAGAANDWRQLATGARALLMAQGEFASVTFDDITLDPLNVKPGAVLTLAVLDHQPNILKLRVDGAEVTGRFAAGKTLRLSCSNCAVSDSPGRDDINSKLLRFRSEREHVVAFSGRKEGTTMALELPPGTKLVEQDIGVAGGLDFTRMEGRRRKSTITGEGGMITFEELDKEVKVKAGDFVILDDLKNFFIETLHIADGITVILHGHVGRLATGRTKFVKDRLPSLLEWLYARKTWALHLNAVVLIGTTALAILQRLRIVREEK